MPDAVWTFTSLQTLTGLFKLSVALKLRQTASRGQTDVITQGGILDFEACHEYSPYLPTTGHFSIAVL